MATKIRPGLYELELTLTTGEAAVFTIDRTNVGDDERLRWIVTAETHDGRTVLEFGDSDEHTTKRDAVAAARQLAKGVIPHANYGWVYDHRTAVRNGGLR